MKLNPNIVNGLETLAKNNELTFSRVFELAANLKLTLMDVAERANGLGLRIMHCQLGCF